MNGVVKTMMGTPANGATDFFFGDSGRLHTGIGKGTRAGGLVSARKDGTLSVIGWNDEDVFTARRFDASGRNPSDPLAGESSGTTADSSMTAQASSAGFVATPGVSGDGSADEGSPYSVTLASVTDRQVSWGDGTIESIPDGQPDADHPYDDGPNTYSVFASTHPGPISVAAPDVRTFGPNIGTVVTDSVSLAEVGETPTAELDLNHNDLLVDYEAGTASPWPALNRWSWYGYDHGDMNGITSGTTPEHDDRIHAVGDNGALQASSFNGRPLDPNDRSEVLVKYTYFGDANLDGQVTTDDYVAVDLNLGRTDAQWVQGDMDGNGTVTTDDYVVIDLNLGKQLPPSHDVTVSNIAPTPTINGAPGAAAPGTPINLTSTVTDPSQADTAAGFTYAWSVTKNGSPFASGTAASFSFTPDTVGTYLVTLGATDKDGGSSTDAKTISVIEASAIAFSVPSTAQINLDWTDSTDPNVVGYAVYRGATADFVPSSDNVIALELDTSEFQDVTVTAATTYYYKIADIMEDGTELGASRSGSATTLTTDTAPPSAPTALTSFAANDTEITLRWNDTSANETGFSVLQSDGAGGWTPVGTTEPNDEGHTMPCRALAVMMVCGGLAACGQTGPAGGGHDGERDRTALGAQFAAFDEGLVAGNPAAIRAFLYVKDDPDGRVVEAQTRRILANIQFLRAIRQDWGIAHGENPFDEFHIFLADDFMAFSGLEIEGDRATVDLEDFDRSVVKAVPSLIKVNGVWKIDLTPGAGGAPAPALAAAISKYADVVERTAAGMKAGKLKTVEDVKRALDAAPKFEPTDYTPDLVLSLPAKE